MQVLSNKKRQRGGIGMNAEDELRKKIGKENPFKVPEGYFADFTSKMMDKLPEKMQVPENARVSTWTKLKPLLYMAAMFVGAALIIRVASSRYESSSKNMASTDEDSVVISDEMIDYAVAGTRMDDYSLYVYLCNAGDE